MDVSHFYRDALISIVQLEYFNCDNSQFLDLKKSDLNHVQLDLLYNPKILHSAVSAVLHLALQDFICGNGKMTTRAAPSNVNVNDSQF
jgi:hypothetical protein